VPLANSFGHGVETGDWDGYYDNTAGVIIALPLVVGGEFAIGKLGGAPASVSKGTTGTLLPRDIAILPELEALAAKGGAPLKGELAAATARPLDWSIVSGAGETRQVHVGAHAANNLQKPLHGVFYGDPVAVTNDAWAIAQQQGITPIRVYGLDFYIVPRPNSGWAGGLAGQGQNLNGVTIITRPGTNQIITAYAGNGTPLPRKP
jgi:hypothetical protein